jgi:hypothetical protein
MEYACIAYDTLYRSQNFFKISFSNWMSPDTTSSRLMSMPYGTSLFKTRSFKFPALRWAFFSSSRLRFRSFVRVSSYRCRDKISWFLLSIFIQAQHLLLDVSPVINIFPISSTTIFNISIFHKHRAVVALLLFVCSQIFRSNHLMDPSTDTFPFISWHLVISPFRHLI